MTTPTRMEMVKSPLQLCPHAGHMTGIVLASKHVDVGVVIKTSCSLLQVPQFTNEHTAHVLQRHLLSLTHLSRPQHLVGKAVSAILSRAFTPSFVVSCAGREGMDSAVATAWERLADLLSGFGACAVCMPSNCSTAFK